ncbi:BnaA09g07900D [Brassica napus]|uniref:BnaA09g07900D protein n=1 Tax=Brassica napus TaxID=3708 RepID=A0A078FW26_BRANA|nr:BnaA09g07900D [Brassica napus]
MAAASSSLLTLVPLEDVA